MTTHIALEEGHDLEEVMGWPAKRKILHAQMLGAYHEERNQQMEQGESGYDDLDMGDVDTGELPDPSDYGASPDTPTAAGTGGGDGDITASHPAAARHGNSFDVDTETDWQFCEQCHGLFEPGEYEQHYEMSNFDCVAE